MDRELQHIKTALQHCQFPSWALNQWQYKFTHPNQQPTNTSNNNSPADNNKNKATIVVPYIPSTGEKFKKLCKRKAIQVHFKGTNILRTALGNPKDKDPKTNQTGIIYHYQCPHLTCSSAYIGKSGRSLGERLKEHFKAPSPIHHHSTTTGHPMDPNQFNIVHKEVNSHSRTIKEAMFIHIQDPTLNRNLGKYQLLHIWDHLLQASPTLQPSPATIQPPHQLLNIPPTGSPLIYTPLLLPIMAGGHILSFSQWQVHTFVLNTPSPYLQQVLQQHHLGKFLTFYLLG